MLSRPYQREVVAAAWQRFEAGQRSTFTVLPTGTGKGHTYAALAQRWLTEKGTGVLILAHRRELIAQNAEEFELATGLPCQVEMAAERVDWWRVARGGAVSASIQTLHGRRLAQAPERAVGLVIIDEAHHASTGGAYHRVLDRFPGAKVFGGTATPDRSDGKPIIPDPFEDCCYDGQLKPFIDGGWLAGVTCRYVPVQLDLTALPAVTGDFADKQVAAVWQKDKHLFGTAKAVLDSIGERPCVAFCASVPQARDFAAVLNSFRGGAADYVASYRLVEGGGRTPFADADRRALFSAFKQGRFQVLCNYGVLTEGTNLPAVAAVAVLRFTKSRSLYAQMIGRGLRLLPGVIGPDLYEAPDAERAARVAASAKPDCLVLDFAGVSGLHQLVHVLDLLAPADADPKQIALARKIVEQAGKSGRAVGADDAMAEAKARLERHGEEVQRLRRKLAAQVAVEFRLVPVDPFAGQAERQVTPQAREDGPRRGSIDDWQVDRILSLARQLGRRFREEAVLAYSRRQGFAVMNDLKRQRDAGAPSPAMAHKLRRLGLPVPPTWGAAKAKLDEVSPMPPRRRVPA